MAMINEMINNLKSQIHKDEYERFIKLVEYVRLLIIVLKKIFILKFF